MIPLSGEKDQKDKQWSTKQYTEDSIIFLQWAYLMNVFVPDECFSRNASYALSWISTFLLCAVHQSRVAKRWNMTNNKKSYIKEHTVQ
jgi:hypothetical protein